MTWGSGCPGGGHKSAHQAVLQAAMGLLPRAPLPSALCKLPHPRKRKVLRCKGLLPGDSVFCAYHLAPKSEEMQERPQAAT